MCIRDSINIAYKYMSLYGGLDIHINEFKSLLLAERKGVLGKDYRCQCKGLLIRFKLYIEFLDTYL